MSDFHLTRAGQRFYEKTMPKLVEVINRLAAAIEEYNKTNKTPIISYDNRASEVDIQKVLKVLKE